MFYLFFFLSWGARPLILLIAAAMAFWELSLFPSPSAQAAHPALEGSTILQQFLEASEEDWALEMARADRTGSLGSASSGPLAPGKRYSCYSLQRTLSGARSHQFCCTFLEFENFGSQKLVGGSPSVA